MNIIKFLESFTTEGMINSMQAKGSRRDSFNQFQNMGKVAAMAAVPFGLSAFLAPTKANAATFMGPQETPTEALQLALTLEYLEDEFYAMALDSGIIPAADQAIIAQIAKHENAHVSLLANALGADAPAKPTFDFTAGGNFDPFNDYPTLLALAQAFEDTGVRAYKGQAGNLISNGDLLTTALQIHSVEAMHASQIRRLRGQKGWIVGSDRGGLPAAAQAVYDGEELAVQAGFNTSTVPNIPAAAGPESFDEPITGPTAVSIASLFIV
ncbi:ferritin-like domain-containing protein [Flavobacterium sp. DG1-102-2]|uniref:ferritin-like domain-containing protein n=1 Tax=Flavobacterium sp. DG1-102-2 TaxID=3081663 RepID=UPI002949E1EB|nr:ferritin-like domain-containing protein [Flavobacterium sp. DG1-102-2]MDV6170322.1 ferritin-like domain-containing protein [Flavobacterium sp. DG1-102-2]